MTHAIKWSICLLMLALSGCNTYHITTNPSVKQSMAKAHAQYAAIRQGKIEYYRFGSGSPIVLIPGYATDVSGWNREFLLGLAQHHELIVLNNRNVGGSVIHSTRYKSKDLANDISQLIEYVQIKKPTIIGISMGGMIAEQLAATHEDQIGKLILINTAIAGRQSIHPSPEIEKAMLNIPYNKLGRYIMAVNLFFPPSSRLNMAYQLAVDRFQPDHYIEIDPASIFPQQRQLILDWAKDNSTAKKLQKIGLPVLILNGEADAVIPPKNSQILAKTFRHATLIRYKEGGHAMIYQYPKEITSLIHTFIQSAG
jgi:pimeloyl-ACP methyl ester carboxylesterase